MIRAPESLTCGAKRRRTTRRFAKVETAAFGQPNEAALVDALRAAKALVLSGVAEVGGRIVGHLAFSPVMIEAERGSFGAIALAPTAVHPDCQRKRVGSALIRWRLEECWQDGHELVIFLGHPRYYPRFGFVPAMTLNFRPPFEAASEAFLLLKLRPGVFAGRGGTVRYPPEFDAL